MAVYLVEGPKGKTLVECRTKVSAINHVAGKDYKVETLTTKELSKLMNDGLKVEFLSDDEKAEDKPATPAKAEDKKPAVPGFAQKKTA